MGFLSTLFAKRGLSNSSTNMDNPIGFSECLRLCHAYDNSGGYKMSSRMILIATFSYQYCKVLSSGSTSYDAVYDIRVIGQKLNGKQLSLAIFALFGICAMLAYIAMG